MSIKNLKEIPQKTTKKKYENNLIFKNEVLYLIQYKNILFITNNAS
jgi:hypothetical protein